MDVFEQLIVRYGRRLGGKVIVGPTNPAGPDGTDGYGNLSARRSLLTARALARYRVFAPEISGLNR
jgi:hypothetical protein